MSTPNPFRRHVHDTAPPTAAGVEGSGLLPHDNRPRLQTSTSTKKVRVTSPPLSSDSPTFKSRLEEHQDSPDHFIPVQSTAETDLDELVSHRPSNHDRLSEQRDEVDGSSSSDSEEEGQDDMAQTMILQRPTGTSTLPYNPFSRTLASMESELGMAPSTAAQTEKEAAGLDTEAYHPHAATMDVNAFKNLLMTGKTAQVVAPSSSSVDSTRGASTPRPYTFAFGGDNSSSTDTSSSLSRHSLIENTLNETPRTSYEKDTSDDDGYGQAATTSQRTGSNRAKPPPPKHTHGKSLQPTGPQIVSFAAFGGFEGVKPDSNAVPSPSNTPRALSVDKNHPLPPIPPKKDTSPSRRPDISPRASTDSTTPDSLFHKKLPPPPPIARRSSQRNALPPPISGRSRSNTAGSQVSIQEDDEGLAGSLTPSASKTAPPPPPPARRSINHVPSRSVDESASSNQIPTTLSPQSDTGLSRQRSLKSPPPPPAHHRAASNLSTSSFPLSSPTATPMPAQAGPSSNYSQHALPPPPPPPRRTSSKSSIDISTYHQRRTSNDFPRSSFDSERRPSISSSLRRSVVREEVGAMDYSSRQGSLGAVSSSGGGGGGGNILADMDAFQREIEGLMGRGNK